MLTRESILTAKLLVEPLATECLPGAMLEGLAGRESPVMLESTALHETYGRFALLSCEPLRVITLREGVLTDQSGSVLGRGDRPIWEALGEAFDWVRLEGAAGGHASPYAPGWIGYVGYEVGRHVEHLPGRCVRDTSLPDLRLGFYDALAIYDALERRWWLAELRFDSPPAGAGRSARTLRALAAETRPDPHGAPPAPTEQADAAARGISTGAQSNFSPQAYRRAVARCVEYIAAGDIFQVNLSQRFTVRDAPGPLDIYRSLRRRNPAWYAAYMTFESSGQSCAVLSSSPELFLRVRGDRVVTRPIKGTRPRIGEPGADAAAAAELLASAKDNAELAMIVDLLRNDLGRVCEYGSIRVSEPRRLETHPTVFHLVGTVEGRLCPGVSAARLLRATFPGGSITGAPKIRAMEIIDELESVARGVYTGCVGIVGVDGSTEWNIAIRTIVCDGDTAYVQVGGGIVADSRPDDEYDETLDKARAMLEAIAETRNLKSNDPSAKAGSR